MEERDEGAGRPGRPRSRALLVGLGVVGLLLLAIALDRIIVVRPGAGQVVVVSRAGEVTGLYGPGQVGYANPWVHARAVYDTTLATADRSAGTRGMSGLTAEGYPVTLFGTAFWQEGNEADIRWRAAHIRERAATMEILMGATVQAVSGRFPIDDLIRRGADVQAALTADLKARARELIRVEVMSFVLTGIDPGDIFREVVKEREMARARLDSVVSSPALTTSNPNALELERIRRWDGRGTIPELNGRERGEAKP